MGRFLLFVFIFIFIVIFWSSVRLILISIILKENLLLNYVVLFYINLNLFSVKYNTKKAVASKTQGINENN